MSPTAKLVPTRTLDPLRIYDYLTQSRERVFSWVRPLSADQYAREFPIGLGSLARTLTHVMICEWMYVARIEGRAVPPYAEWPIQDENPPPFADLAAAWTEQARQTRAVLSAVVDWNTTIEYRTTQHGGPGELVTTSPADLFTQIAFHEVHHRAQALNMLRHLGVATDDIDFNALMADLSVPRELE